MYKVNARLKYFISYECNNCLLDIYAFPNISRAEVRDFQIERNNSQTYMYVHSEGMHSSYLIMFFLFFFFFGWVGKIKFLANNPMKVQATLVILSDLATFKLHYKLRYSFFLLAFIIRPSIKM